jgi:hypothetical protein
MDQLAIKGKYSWKEEDGDFAGFFQEGFSDLLYFHYVHGSLKDLHKLDPELNEWVNVQKRYFWKGELGHDYIEDLGSAGVSLFIALIGMPEEIARRLDCLLRSRRETGQDIPSKYHENKEYGAFTQWLTRQKRAFVGGTLSQEVIDCLADVGIKLTKPNERYSKAGAEKERETFEKNLELLKSCLDKYEDDFYPRDFSHKNIKESKDIEKTYRFLEHIILKARNGTLPEYQKKTLIALNFTMNNVPMEQVMKPGQSRRGNTFITPNIHQNQESRS